MVCIDRMNLTNHVLCIDYSIYEDSNNKTTAEVVKDLHLNMNVYAQYIQILASCREVYKKLYS